MILPMCVSVLIVGFGISGKASAALLEKRGIPWVAVDKKGPIFDSADYPLDSISQVILSPGIPRSHPIVYRAIKKGIEVIGEVELALRLVENRCVGVTGSNGKTTTCSLITHALNTWGVKAKAVGNIGSALSSYLLEADREEILVIELSSFQLETLQTRNLEVGVILNITPNHLDRHASMDEYAKAKLDLQNCLQGPLFISSQVDRNWADLLGMRVVFDEEGSGSTRYVEFGAQNVLAAEKVCAYFGVSKENFIKALPSFKKPPHRMEFLGEKNGLIYYNDSKATSVEAVMHGVSLLEGHGVLIAGGVHKGASYQPWIQSFAGKVKLIVAFGEAASKMEEELAADFSFKRVDGLSEAADFAASVAEKGEFILLSPGCSSYDQFKSYEHRGDAFRKWFKKELFS
jgi:UDP-N-acetylmuramoylalanine--D-glutamate ligase